MVALRYVSVGTFVVVRNLGPIVTLAIESSVHRGSGLQLDGQTVGSLLAVVVGVLLYEDVHAVSFSPLGVTLLLFNIIVGKTTTPAAAAPLRRRRRTPPSPPR
eukprot:3636607-Prymnesium_polylepis.1